MVQIKVLGSSSKGNGYIIDCGDEKLILEAGVKWEDALKACRYKVSKIVGCLVSHQHGDHARYIKDYASKGFPVYCPQDTIYEAGLTNKAFVNSCKGGDTFFVGGFTIKVIKANHDVECNAYIIGHGSFGKIVFVTDTCNFPYRVRNVSLWMIEANFAEDIAISRIAEGLLTPQQYSRLIQTHMSIDNTIMTLSHNAQYVDRSKPKMHEVMLLHLSDGNSNAREFVQKVATGTGLSAIVADKGITLDLDLTEV